MPDVFMLGVLVLLLLFVVAEIWALVRWTGTWRAAAVACGLAVCLALGRIALDIRANPASHNMWPFEVIIWSGLGLVLLGGVGVVRLIVARRPLVP